MARRVVSHGGLNFAFESFEPADLAANEVRVRVDFAAPKHGTETKVMTSNPHLRKRWDPQLRIFLPRAEAAADPGAGTRPVGNMVVGTVCELGAGVERWRMGDSVFGYGPISELHQAHEDHWIALADLRPTDAVCVDPAHVAFVAVRDGTIRVGDDVAISGLGAIGLMAVRIARAAGAATILAVDPIASRRASALAHGADAVFDPMAGDVGLAIKRATADKGVDVAIETSGNSRALHEAVRCLRQCGTVVHVPFGPQGAVDLRMDEEFHHNRPTIIGSQAWKGWGNPDRDFPRWDHDRAYAATIDLFARGLVHGEGIVTPIVPFDDLLEPLTAAFHQPESAIKLGVTFG